MTQPDSAPLCPACLSRLSHVSQDGCFYEFDCGCVQRISDGKCGSVCTRAFDTAVALRAELAAAKTEIIKRGIELVQLRVTERRLEVERDAPKVSVDNLEHENRALAHLHSRAVDERDTAWAWAALWKRAAKNISRNFMDLSEEHDIDQGLLCERINKLNTATAELEALKATLTLAKCIWCGHVCKRDDIAVHIFDCIKNPMGELAREWESKKDELTAAYAALAERLRAVTEAARGLDYAINTVQDWGQDTRVGQALHELARALDAAKEVEAER